ncbi:CDP-alcohol phosphatidyltransferase family protein [Skermania sp. ID1734]|uniref:CDP-alcohol phosphatidyltransferase family protein n=1 Tax=Skermania sp. ID1734 TaxID=2597516 RepID=UPI00117C76FB|nr:CDP-alcohol phosphatidyltransferase family protein [Skermania sp. ID1734]TSE01403.1 CDP-alcohol phosphatidyltransferase family protein [Skermania sp. ID1734]
MGNSSERATSAEAPPATRSERILTVPNVLSIIRLIGVPVFLYLLLVLKADWWAFALLVLSGVTDWLDGKLARLLGQTSRLGALLDPLVDRLYMVTTLIGFVIRGIIPWWIAALLIGRDLVLTLTLRVYRRRGLPPPDVIYLGKAATFALMAAFPWMLAAQADWPGATGAGAFGYACLGWGCAVYVWTGILYLGKAIAVAREIPVASPR